MPPKVERVSPEVSVKEVGYFCLVMDSPESFDAVVFDAYAYALMSPKDSPSQFYLKWIVRGETVIFFPDDIRHSVMNYRFESNGDTSPLHAAGYLTMQKVGGQYTRTIWGASRSLDGVLSTESSDTYKKEQLRQRLNAEGTEPYFLIY